MYQAWASLAVSAEGWGINPLCWFATMEGLVPLPDSSASSVSTQSTLDLSKLPLGCVAWPGVVTVPEEVQSRGLMLRGD